MKLWFCSKTLSGRHGVKLGAKIRGRDTYALAFVGTQMAGKARRVEAIIRRSISRKESQGKRV